MGAPNPFSSGDFDSPPRDKLTTAMRALRLSPFVIAVIAGVGSASAAPDALAKGGSTAEERAFDLFEKSKVAYREGRFAEAADLLAEAYKAKPEPVLLYNLGRACEGLGDLQRAIGAYTSN